MLKIPISVIPTMLIGSIVAGGSFIMFGIGKFLFDPRTRCLKDAPEIRDTSDSGYGYLQGPLHTDTPITHCDKSYVRLDESVFHITTTRIIGYDLHTNEKRSDFEKKAEFVHRTAKQAKPIFVNNIDIGVFIKSITLKPVDIDFTPIENFVSGCNTNGQVTNVNINNTNSDTDYILGEHEKRVIGIEHRRSGIKAAKVYTIFGYYDAEKKKMKKSDKFINIVTRQSRDDLVQHEEQFSKGWKLFWGAGMLAGAAIGGIGMALKN